MLQPPTIRVVATPVRPYYQKAFPWWLGTMHVEAEVKEDGSFVLEGLGDLEYVIDFRLPLQLAVPAPVLVRFSRTGIQRLPTIHLLKALESRIVVLGPPGDAPIKSRVRLYYRGVDGIARDIRVGEGLDRPMVTPCVYTDDDGKLTIRGLHPTRTYTMYVIPIGSKTDLLPRTIEEWNPLTDAKIVLKRQNVFRQKHGR